MIDKPDRFQADKKLAMLRERAKQGLPAYLGIDIIDLAPGYLTARMELTEHHLATNGYLHAGSSCGTGRHILRFRLFRQSA